MRILTLCLFCGALAAQNAPVRTSLCSVEGRVVSEAGAPLADVKLRLEPPAPPGTSWAARVAFVTVTDERGNFAFAGIEPGSYTFSAERAGYLKGVYGARRSSPDGAPFTLAAGETKQIVFRLKQQGVITGRVVTPDGDAGEFIIRAARARYVNGKRQYAQTTASGGTGGPNDLGEFRIAGLEPGRYYLVASAFPAVAPQDLSGTSREPYQTTLYPSTTDPSAAEVLEVTAGATISGLEIRPIRSEAFTVRGRIVNRTGQELEGLSITRIPATSFDITAMFADRSGTGRFEIGAVSRGRISTVVAGMNREGRAISTRHTIEVNGPVDNLELAINQPLTIQGTVKVENGAIPAGLKAALAMQEGALDVRLARDAAVREDGGFTLPDVSLDRYFVSVSGLPRGYYVKSIRLGEEDALVDGVNITRKTEEPIEILLSAKAATIRGAVTGEGAGAAVALVPQDRKRRARPEFYRNALTDGEGKFTLEDLPPGEYKVFAWHDVENGAWMDPDFLKPVEEQGKPVTLREGEAAAMELTAVE